MSSGLREPPLGESDTRSKLIDPAIHARGWTEEHIRREETAGAIEIIDGKPRRRSKGRVDYTLRVRVTIGGQPVAVAVIEAKAENLPPGHGLEQAKSYARCKRLNVPFAFSSNGRMFVEYDNFAKRTSPPRPMAEFPTCDELRARYEASLGFSLAEEVAKPLITPYSGGEAKRRYYQDAAIRAVFEKVAKAEKDGEPKRALLSLATGAGKTFIAVQLLRRVADAGRMGRLFVCDRDELRTQALGALQNEFGNDVAAVSTRDPQKNARIVQTKRKLLDECNLHCIVSLPGGVFNAAGAGVKTNLLFFNKGEPTEKIWYYDLSDVKVGKRQPFTLDKFDEFFRLLPKRKDSERSWTVDFVARKKRAGAEAAPLKKQATAKQQEANRWKEELTELKKAKSVSNNRIAEAEHRITDLTREARELAARAQAIEDAVYDLKAVNPNKQAEADTRTPGELLDTIEAKGREVAEALAVLRLL